MTPDSELLRQYAEEGSEAAFAELVERHLNLVYSVALRVVAGDTHLAQDAAQLVFTDLASNARALSRRAVLAGWLHTSARFAASNLVRSEHRRRVREQKAPVMPDVEQPPEETWVQLRPMLDEAIGRLGRLDRDAVLLRYFEGKGFKDVGSVLGVNENTARLRVDRALDKLRRVLTRRGVSLSSSALAAMLVSEAVGSAPAGLAPGIVSAALANTAAGSGLALAIVNLMNGTSLKWAATTSLIILGLGTGLFVQHQALDRLRQEGTKLRERMHQLELDAQASEQRAERQVDRAEEARLRKEHDDLLRLRGEVTLLRQQLRAGVRPSGPMASNDPGPELVASVNSYVANVKATVGDKGSLVTGGWTTKPGRRTLVFVSPQTSGPELQAGQVLITSSFVEAPDEVWDSLGFGALKADTKSSSLQKALEAEESRLLLKTLKETPGVEVLASPRVQTAAETQASIFDGETQPVGESGAPVQLGHGVDVLARFPNDPRNIELSIQARFNALNSSRPGAPGSPGD